MADSTALEERPHTRRPLGPGEGRANIQPSSQSNGKSPQVVSSTPTSRMPAQSPHGEERSHRRGSPAESPGHQRVAAIIDETARNTKRDSEISNASSTASGGRKRTIGRWQLGKTVGRGGCSTVRLVRHQDTGQIGAVKIISRKMAEQVRAQSLANLLITPDETLQELVAAGTVMAPPPPGLMREIAIMKLLDHPNIVQLYDVWENHNEL